MKAKITTAKAKRVRRMIAYHEAGHAVAARVLGIEVSELRVANVTSYDDDYQAHAQTRSAAYFAEDNPAAKVAGFEIDLKVALAGPLAQMQAGYSFEFDFDDPDMQNAMSSAAKLARLGAGLPAEPASDQKEFIGPGDPLHVAVWEIFNRVQASAAAVVHQNWIAIIRVAAVLQRQDRLDQAELDCLITGRAQ
jgi:hypothetical protein